MAVGGGGLVGVLARNCGVGITTKVGRDACVGVSLSTAGVEGCSGFNKVLHASDTRITAASGKSNFLSMLLFYMIYPLIFRCRQMEITKSAFCGSTSQGWNAYKELVSMS